MTPPQRWFEKPAAWIAAGLGTVVFVVLFTPAVDIWGTVAQLSSFSAAPGGARGLYELADRLGWDVSRSDSPELPASSTTAVYAVLDPPLPLTAGEVHDLLTKVRSGAGLLTVAGRNTPLADSLGVRAGEATGGIPWDSSDVCPEQARFSLRTPLWDLPAVEITRNGPSRTVPFLMLDRAWIGAAELPAIVGFSYGQGRVGVVSDPMLLTNDAIRECRYGTGLAIAGVLRYLKSGPRGATRSALVFDEFHQGYGVQPSVGRAASRTLVGTEAGRGLLQLSFAGIVLLAAVSPRPLSVREQAQPRRRSPLEHVQALASAYQAVGATRTATRLLVHGLRRRLSHGSVTRRPGTDEIFLRELASARPKTRMEVERVLRSLTNPTTARELVATRDSIRRIERILESEHD